MRESEQRDSEVRGQNHWEPKHDRRVGLVVIETKGGRH